MSLFVPLSWALLAYWVAGLYLVHLIVDYVRAVRSIRNFPGVRQLLWPTSLLSGGIVEGLPFITQGTFHLWKANYQDCIKYDADVVSGVCFWPKAQVWFDIADPELVKIITSTKGRCPKPVDALVYEGLRVFGDNIITTEGEPYRKHRKIANPAFSEPNNKLVFNETVGIMVDLFDNVWENKPEVHVKHVLDITSKLTVLIIGSAGFGRKLSWRDDAEIPAGHKLTFSTSLLTVLSEVLIHLAVPSLAKGLTKRTRHVRLAYKEFKQYMEEMIEDRKVSEENDEHHDLFSNLLAAAESEKGTFTNDELFGNIFVFLMAGQETTAHAVGFALAFLALYPEEQESLYQHLSKVLPDRRLPTYDDIPALTPTLNVFNETLRLRAPVGPVEKTTSADRLFATRNWKGEKREVFIPAGSSVRINVPAIHHNTRYWDEPEAFRPSRFNDPNWPREAFLPFSAGSRSCIGRRFAETDATVILTMFVQRYKVEIDVEPKFANETPTQRKTRILYGNPGITLGPKAVPLVFKRRW